MILVIDNYDSFTYNLVQYLGELGADIEVVRNDVLTLAEIEAKNPTHIVISPGPGRPKDAGISEAVIAHFGPKTPILGVCLGHQAIGEVFGGKIIHAPTLMHGKTSMVKFGDSKLFKGLPNPFRATRYHSLIIEKESLPKDLILTAWTEDGVIMGVRHPIYPIEGIQFHPESILTDHGKEILKNFLEF